MMMRQLALPLPVRTALGREDFYVTSSNALAVAHIDGWRTWHLQKLVLTGPEGAGKTHLAGVWARQAKAQVIQAASLPDLEIPSLTVSNLCVENVPEIAGNPAAEEALFHLHNLVLAQGHALLMTARTAPSKWALELPDLKSRILGAPLAAMSEPDDDLLGALLIKLFADRQIVPAPDVVPFLTRQMPRNYRAAQKIVEALDAAALGRPKGVSRPLASRILATTFPSDPH